MTTPEQYASVRYLVDDVQAAVDFYTKHLGFTVHTSAAPAFTDVVRGPLRLLLSGPASSGARATPADADTAGCAVPGCRSAASWCPAPADGRSWWPTRRAT